MIYVCIGYATAKRLVVRKNVLLVRYGIRRLLLTRYKQYDSFEMKRYQNTKVTFDPLYFHCYQHFVCFLGVLLQNGC